MTSVRRLRVLYVVGARPNFVKVAPVMAAGDAWNDEAGPHDLRFRQTLVHTGQHYDQKLSEVFFEQLGLPEPDEYLGVGSGSHAVQTGRLLQALEPVVQRYEPDLVVVPGDVNSTLAAALTAAKLNIPVAHLEAGLRSLDKTMPEEINRIVADHCADLLFTTCEDADENLSCEGIEADKVRRVGNTMIDTLLRLLPLANEREGEARLAVGVTDGPFVLVTLHRPSNVDDPKRLESLLGVLGALGGDLPVVFPVHPRTRRALEAIDNDVSGLHLAEPLGYLEFMALMNAASAVVTDSGGVQEETSVIGVPCVTVRTSTERPVTCRLGTNTLVDPADDAAIFAAVRTGCAAARRGADIPLWDGHAGERVIHALAEWATTLERGLVPASVGVCT